LCRSPSLVSSDLLDLKDQNFSFIFLVDTEAGVAVLVFVCYIGCDDIVWEFSVLQDIPHKGTLNKRTLPKVTTIKVHQSWDRHRDITKHHLSDTGAVAF